MDEWHSYKKVMIGVAALFIVMLVVIVYLLVVKSRPLPSAEPIDKQALVQVTEESTEERAPAATGTIYVDLKGAVVKPGMYQVSEQARVLDVVELAGGFTQEAETLQVNFSQLVHDQMVIFIPKVGEAIPEVLASRDEVTQRGAEDGATSDKININVADSQELQQLSGIGAKKAEAIIAYREEHGSFKTVAELSKVSGFGDKTVEKLKEHITV